MQKGAAHGPPRDVQDCGGTGHAPSPPPRHQAEEKRRARAKAGPGDSDNASRKARASPRGFANDGSAQMPKEARPGPAHWHSPRELRPGLREIPQPADGGVPLVADLHRVRAEPRDALLGPPVL